MNNVALTIAFSRGDYKFLAPKVLPTDLVESCVFNSCDYTSLEQLKAAINAKRAELSQQEDEYLNENYIDIVPYPSPKGFYPTGGVRWEEKVWAFHEYINNSPSDDSFNRGDRVRFLNAYGLPLEFSIFGFDDNGDAILDWDCYWVSEPLSCLSNLLLFHDIQPTTLPHSLEPWVNKAWSLAGSQEWANTEFKKGDSVRVTSGAKVIADVVGYSAFGKVIIDWNQYWETLDANTLTAF